LSAGLKAKPALRPFLPADTPVLIEIFKCAIEVLAAEDYDEEQCRAWASRMVDEEAQRERLSANLTLVALLDGDAAGFISLKHQELIDLLFVHPNHARKGVATALCEAVEKLAAARKTPALVTFASDTAKPFFERRGYVSQYRNTVEMNGVWLGNTNMKKMLETVPEQKA
jgi:putative acetyltransferase